MKKFVSLALLLLTIAIIPMSCSGDDNEDKVGGAGTKTVSLACLPCNGNGRCQRCDGVGKVDSLIYKVNCRFCKGAGNCAICRGTGHVDIAVSKDMDANNLSRCGSCSGQAYCPECNGTGKKDSLIYKVNCNKCKGTGWCPTCNGKAYVIGYSSGGNSGGNSNNGSGSSTDIDKNVSLSIRYEDYYHNTGITPFYEAKFTVEVSGVSRDDVVELGFDIDTSDPPSNRKRERKSSVTSYSTWTRVSTDVYYVRPFVRLWADYETDIYGNTEKVDLRDMK